MLFNSQAFILVFLPITLMLFYLIKNSIMRQWFVILASLIFYAYAEIRFLPLLMGSILLNYFIAILLAKYRLTFVFWLGIIANLGLIGYFKYRDFFADNLFEIIEIPYENESLLLPIGISFFTFQQISYLTDILRKECQPYTLRDYSFYVSFFPQLIAGPIVRHNELIPQFSHVFADQAFGRTNRSENMAKGFVIFTIGLAKKLFFADTFAPHSDAVFQAVQNGAVGIIDSWTGLLSFSFQIYFDFSAYSDMAIGLALMMGLLLPYNFNAPYRAVTIQEFWQRWHMTLSRFLRDYLYIPLGGNRKGKIRKLGNILLTMIICGLWHGAGWNFLLWGFWHGAGLGINHAWRLLNRPIPKLFAWAITLLFVMLGWVLFRAEDMSAILNYYQSMFSINENAGAVNEGFKAKFAILSALIIILLPTSQSFIEKYMKPWRIFAVLCTMTFTAIVLELGKGQSVEFIYFEF